MARSIGESELYRRTGIQLMPINTIFQLAAHDRDELARARRARDAPRAGRLRAHRRGGRRALQRRHDRPPRRRDGALGGRSRRGDRRRPADPADTRGRRPPAGGARRHARPPRRGARHGMRVRREPARRRGSRLRLRRDLVHRRRRARGCRHLRAGPRRELLERGRSPRRLPLPQERDGVLVARTVRVRMGRHRPRPARSRRGRAGGAGLRRARRAVSRTDTDGRGGARRRRPRIPTRPALSSRGRSSSRSPPRWPVSSTSCAGSRCTWRRSRSSAAEPHRRSCSTDSPFMQVPGSFRARPRRRRWETPSSRASRSAASAISSRRGGGLADATIEQARGRTSSRAGRGRGPPATGSRPTHRRPGPRRRRGGSHRHHTVRRAPDVYAATSATAATTRSVSSSVL